MKKHRRLIVIVSVAAILAVLGFFTLNHRGQTDIAVDASIPRLGVTSPAFEDLGTMPDEYTGRGIDISPGFDLSGLGEDAVSIAIIMDDLDIPWMGNYTHWVIWNISPTAHILEGIAHGEIVPELGGAVQGADFGRNRYSGPMPPFGTHRYQFHIFVLDTTLDLDASCGKSDLLGAMEGHIIQYGALTGWYPREAN